MKTFLRSFASLSHFVGVMVMLFLVTITAHAQETGNGFLNIANLVPAKENVNVTVMGKELVPSGLHSIESTGWFIVPSGTHNLSISCEGFKAASGSVNVEDNASSLYVIYLEPARDKVDKDGKPIPAQLRIKRCPAFGVKKGHYLEVMSVCAVEEPFRVGNVSLNLAPFVSQEIPGWAGGAFKTQHMSKEIGSCAGSQEKGSYFLLIGTDHLGKYSSLMVRNETQELPPWMKKKEKTETTTNPQQP